MFPEVKIKYEEKYDTELFGDLVVGEFYVKDTRARDMVVYVKTGYTSSLALHPDGRCPCSVCIEDNPPVYPVKAQITIEI
jgi:hypothetical protein